LDTLLIVIFQMDIRQIDLFKHQPCKLLLSSNSSKAILWQRGTKLPLGWCNLISNRNNNKIYCYKIHFYRWKLMALEWWMHRAFNRYSLTNMDLINLAFLIRVWDRRLYLNIQCSSNSSFIQLKTSIQVPDLTMLVPSEMTLIS
jgi:hypothetical protein